MENSKSMGLDGINPFPLNLSLPYAVESVVDVYNLFVASNIFRTVLFWRMPQ